MHYCPLKNKNKCCMFNKKVEINHHLRVVVVGSGGWLVLADALVVDKALVVKDVPVPVVTSVIHRIKNE